MDVVPKKSETLFGKGGLWLKNQDTIRKVGSYLEKKDTIWKTGLNKKSDTLLEKKGTLIEKARLIKIGWTLFGISGTRKEKWEPILKKGLYLKSGTQ